jgi:hypothetical protein
MSFVIALLMVLFLFAFGHWIFGIIAVLFLGLYGWYDLVQYRKSIGYYSWRTQRWR